MPDSAPTDLTADPRDGHRCDGVHDGVMPGVSFDSVEKLNGVRLIVPKREQVVVDPPENVQEAGNAFRSDVLVGLSGDPKTLPCKYLYDQHGSELFDQICDLPEYYVTRTELGILRESLDEICDELGDSVVLIEPGAGSGLKTELLLEHASLAAYAPIDISGDYLGEVAERLGMTYPALEILPIAGDFTEPIAFPQRPGLRGCDRVLFFPGSTIGNFTPDAATGLLREWTRLVGQGGRLLIGVDLEKDAATLEAAYDDAAGVTAAFNRNLLSRINDSLDGTFDLDAFTHRAVYNRELARVEMHLVSSREQTVAIDGERFTFAAGESIHTENSHKYSLDRFAAIAAAAGWTVDRVWTDADRLFSVQLLSVA